MQVKDAALDELEKNYTSLLEDYLAEGGEEALERAYELGRKAIADGHGILDIEAVHQKAMLGLPCTQENLKKAGLFCAECVAPFEMTFRGYEASIAELHNLNRTLELSEMKFRSLLQAANDAIISANNDGKVISWNKRAQTIFGYSGEEVLGKPLELLFPQRYRDILSKELEWFRQTGESSYEGKTLEHYGLRKDGNEFPVEISIATWKTEEGAFYTAIFRDITERQLAEEALRRAHDELEIRVRERTEELESANEALQAEIIERRHIEEVLRESEQKYRNLFDNAGDAIINIDLDTRVTSWNRSAERIFGWKTSEAIGRELDSLIIPRDMQAEFKRNLREAVSGKNITGIATVCRRKDGSRVDVGLTISSILNADGKIIGLSGIFRDITESKHAEKERLRLIEEIKKRHEKTENLAMNLKKERDALQIIMENTGTQLAYIDSNFSFIRVNSAYAKGCGHRKEELISKNYFELFPDPENQVIFERVRETGKAAEFKAKPFEFPDQPWRGTTYWDWTLTPTKDAEGKVDRLVLSLSETTEQVLRERSMQKALSYAEGIVDTIPVPLLILDSNQFVKTANNAFYMMFKVSIEETRDRLLYDIGNRQWDIPKLRELLEEVIPKNSQVQDFEVEHEFPSIGRRTMMLNASKFQQDGTDMILLSIEDITQFKKIEELRLENEKLISAEKARSEFLSIMSHELRTPLTSVIGYSILLREQQLGTLNKKQAFYVDSVIENSKHLLSLINNVLDLAKMEAGKLELAVEKVSVPEIIIDSLNLIKESARSRRIVLKKDLDPALDIIEADRQKFKQILFNLLSNALKFSKEGGGIIKVSAKKERSMAKISVSDTGIGIGEEDIPRLFQKFEQLDSGISRKYGGTGLGLAITKQLVELHGGEITVASRYGEGSTFTFLLPIKSGKR